MNLRTIYSLFAVLAVITIFLALTRTKHTGVRTSHASKIQTESPTLKLASLSLSTPEIADAQDAMVGGMVAEGCSLDNFIVNGDIGLYIISPNMRYVEWKFDTNGNLEYIRSFIDGILAAEFDFSYTQDATFYSTDYYEYLRPAKRLAEVEYNGTDLVRLTLFTETGSEYYPLNAGEQPLMTSIITYRECMRNCNFNGSQCTANAKMSAAQASRAALARFGGIVVAGTVTGSVVPGVGTTVGLVGGLVAGVLVKP